MMSAALTAAAMTLGDLLGPGAAGHAGMQISDLVIDSRQVTPGAAFVAVPGGERHGLQFAAEALGRGAAIVLYAPDAAHPEVPEPSLAVPGLDDRLGELATAFFAADGEQPEALGVTGTNGKTTVAWLIANAMAERGDACGYIGTLGFGPPAGLERHALTTPDCLSLHREMAAMGLPRVALEVSSHALAQDRIAGLDIGAGVFTNLTRDHLDAHGDFAAYGDAKARLFRRPGLGTAVLNGDDPFAASLLRELPAGCESILTSQRGRYDADVLGHCRFQGLSGLELELTGRYGNAAIASPLIGEFNAENLLLAAGALVAWGVPLTDACAALAECRPPPGRMEVYGGTARQPWVVVDYAHTPAALERVLATVAAAAPGELWCVFGCGGDRDRGKRPEMGAAAARSAQHIVLTDDNPRGEDPALIVADVRTGIEAHPDVAVVHSREQAIVGAVRAAREGDVVLVAGKGHETTQTIAGRQRPFDDRAVVAETLGDRS